MIRKTVGKLVNDASIFDFFVYYQAFEQNFILRGHRVKFKVKRSENHFQSRKKTHQNKINFVSIHSNDFQTTSDYLIEWQNVTERFCTLRNEKNQMKLNIFRKGQSKNADLIGGTQGHPTGLVPRSPLM